MAKTAKTLSKVAKLIAADDKRLRPAMAKAVREVRRLAALNNTKLVVADEKSWSVPK